MLSLAGTVRPGGAWLGGGGGGCQYDPTDPNVLLDSTGNALQSPPSEGVLTPTSGRTSTMLSGRRGALSLRGSCYVPPLLRKLTGVVWSVPVVAARPAPAGGHRWWGMLSTWRRSPIGLFWPVGLLRQRRLSFLRSMAGLSLRDRVGSTVIREELGVEPLLHTESQMGWFVHLVRIPPGCLLGIVFRARPTGRRSPGRPRTYWRHYVSQLVWEHLGITLEELDEVAGER